MDRIPNPSWLRGAGAVLAVGCGAALFLLAAFNIVYGPELFGALDPTGLVEWLVTGAWALSGAFVGYFGVCGLLEDRAEESGDRAALA